MRPRSLILILLILLSLSSLGCRDFFGPGGPESIISPYSLDIYFPDTRSMLKDAVKQIQGSSYFTKTEFVITDIKFEGEPILSEYTYNPIEEAKKSWKEDAREIIIPVAVLNIPNFDKDKKYKLEYTFKSFSIEYHEYYPKSGLTDPSGNNITHYQASLPVNFKYECNMKFQQRSLKEPDRQSYRLFESILNAVDTSIIGGISLPGEFKVDRRAPQKEIIVNYDVIPEENKESDFAYYEFLDKVLRFDPPLGESFNCKKVYP